jgi:hypothetical protein
MLKSGRAPTRKVATAYVARLGLIRSGKLPASPQSEGLFAPLRKLDPKTVRAGVELITTSAVLRDRLKAMAADDLDAEVRKDAGLALWSIDNGTREK